MKNDMKIPSPRTLDEQLEIMAILDAIDRKIDFHRRKRAVLEELFKALAAQADDRRDPRRRSRPVGARPEHGRRSRMSQLKISEAGTVQFPMVTHAAAIGWTPHHARRRQAEARRRSRHALPGRTGGEARGVQSVAVGRRDPAGHRDNWRRSRRPSRATARCSRGCAASGNGTTRPRSVTAVSQLVDFEHPAENAFHVTWEWTLEAAGPQGQSRRCDVRRQRNAGLHRRAQEPEGRRRHRARHQATAPLRNGDAELLGAPQLFNVTHLLDYWYGVTWNANRRYMARWKQSPRKPTASRCRRSSSRPTSCARLQHWILFYVEDGETRKSVLRQHQRRAIDKIVARCEDPAKTRGLVWHTQGSGKTFTLLTAAPLILERKERFKNATVILVVDRTELEGQLQGMGRKAARRDAAAGHRQCGARTPRPSSRTCSKPTSAA